MRKHITLYLLIGLFCIAQGQEIIKSLHSTIHVRNDGSLDVDENIVVISAQQNIRRGIIREFPTRYSLDGIFNATVDFTITSVQHNKRPVPYQIVKNFNSQEIHIGDNTLIEPGTHLYTIQYKTNKQIGFFKDHDELYWNAIGTNWEFPIMQGSATIHLPLEIPSNSITTEAYTGRYGDRRNDYRVSIKNNTVQFETTKSLGTHEGMTIVVTWPKGIIPEPSWLQKTIWFFQDNWIMLWAALWLLIALCWYLGLFIYSRNQKKSGIVIPLFYPPKHISPAGVGFIHDKEFNDNFIASEIVHMAVNGYITIAYNEAQSIYTLLRTEKTPVPQSHEETFLSTLFNAEKNISISPNSSPQIKKSSAFLKKQCTALYDIYIRHYTGPLTGALICSIIAIIPLSIILITFGIIGFMLVAFIHAVIKKGIRNYTQEGQIVADEINGFKLFLETTEIERLKIIGTPPIKTPELYEHYLPYAMALGIEEAWTQQFTPLFTRLAQENKPYKPLWYTGSRWNSRSFSRGFSTALNASLPQAPGWSSGAKGAGFSGGGGGGGGGRGR